jgi:hypothetical protein
MSSAPREGVPLRLGGFVGENPIQLHQFKDANSNLKQQTVNL